jgi:hypothetical protein
MEPGEALTTAAQIAVIQRKWGRIYIFDILAGDELNLDIF